MKHDFVLHNPPNASVFSTTNKVGGVSGCGGATTGVMGAGSNSGSQYMLKGGTNYHGFEKAACWAKGSYAPFSTGSHNQCGGRKTRHHKSKRHHKSNRHRKSKRHHKSKHCKCKRCHCKNCKCKRRRTYKRRTQRGGYSQYLSNTPISHGYSTGGTISPPDSALATPLPHKAYNNCQDSYNHMSNKV